MTLAQYTEKDIIRFWSRVAKTDNIDKCWNWQGGLRSEDGYGSFWHKGKPNTASRVSWEITHGEIPCGLFVLHECDNPSCCNPNHLFLGTKKDNVQDCIKKGRRPIFAGEANGKHKLTDDQVEYIRERYAKGGISQRQLAREMGVTQANIGYITRGDTRRKGA